MVWNARLPALAMAGAALLLADALVAPASAQEECKNDLVTVSGRTKFRPFTKTRELEGRGAAFADAVPNWRRQVSTRCGEAWDRWTKAKDTTFTCEPTKTGKIIGSSFIGCTISGRPCFYPDPDDEKRGSVAQKRDRDRDGDDDRGRDDDRDRDDSKSRDRDGRLPRPRRDRTGMARRRARQAQAGRPHRARETPWSRATGARWRGRTIWPPRAGGRRPAPIAARWRDRTISPPGATVPKRAAGGAWRRASATCTAAVRVRAYY